MGDVNYNDLLGKKDESLLHKLLSKYIKLYGEGFSKAKVDNADEIEIREIIGRFIVNGKTTKSNTKILYEEKESIINNNYGKNLPVEQMLWPDEARLLRLKEEELESIIKLILVYRDKNNMEDYAQQRDECLANIIFKRASIVRCKLGIIKNSQTINVPVDERINPENCGISMNINESDRKYLERNYFEDLIEQKKKELDIVKYLYDTKKLLPESENVKELIAIALLAPSYLNLKTYNALGIKEEKAQKMKL